MSDTNTSSAVHLEPFIEALETTAFISPIPAESPVRAPDQARMVEMEFASPEYGAVRLVAGLEFGKMLAANQLGVDPSDPEALAGADDALRELMNITCGAVIRRFGAAADQRLHMSLPTVQPFDTQENWKVFLEMPDVYALDADGHIIAFQSTGVE